MGGHRETVLSVCRGNVGRSIRGIYCREQISAIDERRRNCVWGEDNSENIGDFTFDNYKEKNYDRRIETAIELMCRKL